MHVSVPLSRRKVCALIGQAPGSAGITDPGQVLVGRAGQRIAELAGIEFESYRASTLRINLLDEYPGKAPSGKGDLFPLEAGRKAAARLALMLHDWRVLFVGRAVARAFGISNPVYHRWEKCGWQNDEKAPPVAVFYGAVIPHPSGINRWWNDPSNEADARAFLYGLFHPEEAA